VTPQELRDRIKTAVEADIQQFLTDSLTPDRGYGTTVDNVTKLVEDVQRDMVTLFAGLERLVKEKGSLSVTYEPGGGGMGYYWSATISHKWPFCGGSTLAYALESVVHEHQRLEREELQKRINAIDESASL
jgi:hypothetical protein